LLSINVQPLEKSVHGGDCRDALFVTARDIDPALILTDIPVLPVAPILQATEGFMQSTMCCRRGYLQKRYGFGFDGYSHCGQADSTHQAPDDLLHTFVFSDAYCPEQYPQAFQPYIRESWPTLTRQLRRLETAMLDALPVDLTHWYQQSVGHMMSANYYPPQQHFNAVAAGNTRLSAHPDVSLFTVFPFGLDSAFEYEDRHGQWHPAPETDTMIAFPGYLLEWMSDGRIKALNHRVRLDADPARKRYSFAVFSIPMPDATVSRVPLAPGESPLHLTAQAYFEQYGSLWDY
tara:strand:+ start:10516 stop:11385 length:870 start_codon:yes stop_codon:yes gene_type:complete